MDGFPVVYTARWMDASDHIKNIELLKKVGNVSKDKRGCHYTNVIALKDKNLEETFSCTLDGFASNEARGENGLTLTKISIEDKLAISPRKKVLDMVYDFVKKIEKI